MRELLRWMTNELPKEKKRSEGSQASGDQSQVLTEEQLKGLRKREPFAELMEQSAQYIPQTDSKTVTKKTDNIIDLTKHPRFKRVSPSGPNNVA